MERSPLCSTTNCVHGVVPPLLTKAVCFQKRRGYTDKHGKSFIPGDLLLSSLSPALLGGVCEFVNARAVRAHPPITPHHIFSGTCPRSAFCQGAASSSHVYTNSAHFQSCFSSSLGLAKFGGVASDLFDLLLCSCSCSSANFFIVYN